MTLMMSRFQLSTLVLAAAVPLLICATPGEANAKRRSPDGEYKSVTAYSRYGHRPLTASVRRGPVGAEVNLGSNTWISCGVDCSDTLRREKLDYWETRREEGGGGHGR